MDRLWALLPEMCGESMDGVGKGRRLGFQGMVGDDRRRDVSDDKEESQDCPECEETLKASKARRDGDSGFRLGGGKDGWWWECWYGVWFWVWFRCRRFRGVSVNGCLNILRDFVSRGLELLEVFGVEVGPSSCLLKRWLATAQAALNVFEI
jgi:hypothetical protein